MNAQGRTPAPPEASPISGLERTLTPSDAARLVHVVQTLSLLQDTDRTIAIVRDAARELVGSDGVTVVLREGDQVFYADESAIGPLWKGRRFPASACISGWAMIHKQSVAIEDIYTDDRVPVDAYRATFVKSLAMVPVRRADPVAAIGAYWAEKHLATERELTLLQALADSTAIALTNGELMRQAQAAQQERTASLAREQALSRAKDEFLAMLGHELRNPLSPIVTAVELMKLRYGDFAVKERAIIERQAHHLIQLVDDLLDVSRITRGRIELKREALELSDVVAMAVERAAPLLEDKQHRLITSIPHQGLRIEGDRHRLFQVVTHLLTNASKYTEPGGTIEIVGKASGAEAVLSVKDSGIGIAGELLSRMFEPFVQGEQGLDRAQGGLGLGLAIVRNLVQMHGGVVTASSEGRGRGSEFVVRLPLKGSGVGIVAPATTLRRGAAAPTSSRRVLLVDDNRDAAEALGEALTDIGFEVKVFFDSRTALAQAAEFEPEVAVLDIGLPHIDGYELANRLIALPGLTATKLIALTGYGQPSDRQRSLRAGFLEHLIKPVDLKRVQRAIERVLAPSGAEHSA
jgi:signal transduction histidine kinase/CheY-like chemotaxis protein